MHLLSVLHIQGLLLLSGAAFMLAPLPFSLYYTGRNEYHFAFESLLAP